MAYWWVSQNKTYRDELKGGYLWAPIRTKSGRSVYHWNTMSDLRTGDIVFSYVKQYILAVSEVKGNAYEHKNPFFKNGEEWTVDGLKIDLNYKELSKPIRLSEIIDDFFIILEKQVQHKPLNKNGTGVQGYLFPLIDEAGELLCSKTHNL